MFILQETHNVEGVAKLTETVGYAGQVAVDPDSGDIHVKLDGGWKKVAGGDGKPVPVAPSAPAHVTLKNSDGTVTRDLPLNGGVVMLAATDAIVTNGQTVSLQKSDGAESKGNAGLNAPASVIVTKGVVSAVKAAA